MLSQCSLIGFIPSTDADRARNFYVDVLKLKFESEDQFALIVSANGNAIRVVRVKTFTPAPYTILGWEVADIVKEVTTLTEAGVEFARYPYLQQDDLAIWASPSGTRVAWLHDPDGNVLSLSQP
jgi:predicted enzyme related to lactoylglutathione lyase